MSDTMRKAIKFISAYILTVGTGAVTGYGITRIDIVLPLLCILIYFILDAADAKIIKKDASWSCLKALCLQGMTRDELKTELKYALPVSFVFALSVVAGRHIDVWDEEISGWGVPDVLLLMLLTAVFAFLTIVLFKKTDKGLTDDKASTKDKTVATSKAAETKKSGTGLKTFLIFTVFFLICRIPYYLTLFPGNYGKDSFESVDMILGNIPWTNHHPIFFTAFMGLIVKLTGEVGNIGLSLGIFTAIHMILECMTLSYISCRIIGYEKETGSKGYIGVASAVFFAIHPIVAMYSMYITKDVLFSCAVALLVIKLLDIGRETDDKGIIKTSYSVKLCVLMLLTMLLRNNGTLIVFGTGIVMCLCYKKQLLKVLLPLVISMAAFFAFKNIAYRALDIKPESFAESASVPLQQVGYVIKEHTDEEIEAVLTDEEYGILCKVMPLAKVREVYELGYTDSYKFDKDFDDEFFNEHKSEFMSIWAKLLPKFFPEYVTSYLAQTAGYWHYGETNTVATQGVWEDNEIGVKRTDIIYNMTGLSLYSLIEKLMLGMRKAPLLCILSSMAMQFYAILLMFAAMLRRRYKGLVSDEGLKRTITAYMPLVLLWISIMIATPAFCLFRYTYPFFILWPVTIYILINSDKGMENNR